MMKKIFAVERMTCAACQSHVDKAVRNLDGVESCDVNLLLKNMSVIYDENKCSKEKIEEAVQKAGYKAYIKNEENKKAVSKSSSLKKELKRLVISFFLLLVLMYFSMGNMMWNFPVPKIFDHIENPMGFALVQFLLAIPICIINGKYYITGYKRLLKLSPNMDTLISIGSSLSMMYGIYALFMISIGKFEYHMYLYFESASMILVFVSLGKFLEELSKKRTTDSISNLIKLAPKTARILKNGNETIENVDDVNIGDIVVLRKGDIVPVDGKIVDGVLSIDQSNITGESVPIRAEKGESIYASTVVMSGYAKVESLKVGDETSFSMIIKLVEEASSSKAPISKLADRVSSIFVPLVMILSFLTFVANLIYVKVANPSYVVNAFENALNFAITVIVIACPCALGLATPVAIMVGTGKGAEAGLLIKNAETLEEMHRIKTVVFDKTGTITVGKPTVIEKKIYEKDETTDKVIYSMEKRSAHPLSDAILKYYGTKEEVEIQDYKFIEGKGLVCSYNGDWFEIGNDFKEKNESIENAMNEYSKEGATPIVVSKNGKPVMMFAIRDEIKETSKLAVEYLKSEGIKTMMLTGDNERVAEFVKEKTGVEEVVSGLLPSDKAKIIKEIASKGNKVAMVGDGVNDAPALKCANVGIAVGAGSDVSIDAADIVLKRNELIDVVNVVKLSKKVVKTIKLGLFWAFFYNSICIVLATGLLYYLTNGNFKMQPMYGAIAMSVSSVSVVLNALTINLFKPIRIINKEMKKENYEMKEIVIKVEGMMCVHCKGHVEDACKKLPGVSCANASLENNNVTVGYEGEIERTDLIKAIKEAGYKAE